MPILEELYQEINATRDDYIQLLKSIPENAYPLLTDNPAWNIGQVLYHMSIVPRDLSRDVKMILRQNWLYRLIPIVVPKKLFDWLNEPYPIWSTV
jgi:hypothetical protein